MEQRNVLSPGQLGRPRLSPDDIARRLEVGLDPRGRSDFDLEARLGGADIRPGARYDSEVPLTPAAVLVPLVQHADGLTILLTKRTAHLAHHPGQISFPGGRLEPDDGGDFITCALRETEEEVGLDRRLVRMLGRLDDYVTGTGFTITPVVGVAQPGFSLRLDDFEVAEVFEVPLDFVIDHGNHELQHREYKGRQRPFWSMTWEGHYIWGATAGILVNLADVLAHQS